jgi:hypothetical protein
MKKHEENEYQSEDKERRVLPGGRLLLILASLFPSNNINPE